MRDGIYYLSWGTDYATSTNIYGPYQSVGRTGQGFGLGPFAHGSFFEWKGQLYHVWCYYLEARISSSGPNAQIEVRRDSPTGPLLGTLTDYQWTLDGAPLASGPNPEISLGIGTHVISLLLTYPDTDEDGLPDQWKMQNFKTLAMSASGDEDGDGKSNLEEFIAGTDPNDPNSRFKVTSVTPDGGGGTTIRWDSVNGRIYTVYKSTDLTTNSWIAATSPQPGTGAEMIYTAPAGGLRKFYRVGVSFFRTGY